MRLMKQRNRCHCRKAGLIATTLLAGGLFLLASFDAWSAMETWNPVAGGGSGMWDTNSRNWNSGQIWSSGGDASFSGTGGTVTVVNPSANSLTFSASGPYLLTGGTLTLTGSDVTVNSDVTISSATNFSAGLFETGTGTLTLKGATNDYYTTIGTGAVDIESGGAVRFHVQHRQCRRLEWYDDSFRK